MFRVYWKFPVPLKGVIQGLCRAYVGTVGVTWAQNWGCLCGGPHNKEYSIFGLIIRAPIWSLPKISGGRPLGSPYEKDFCIFGFRLCIPEPIISQTWPF